MKVKELHTIMSDVDEINNIRSDSSDDDSEDDHLQSLSFLDECMTNPRGLS